LRQWGELVAGQWVHTAGNVVNLSATEWWERWRAFRARLPEQFATAWSAEAKLQWHDRQLQVCKHEGQGDAAFWHLNQLLEARPDDPHLKNLREEISQVYIVQGIQAQAAGQAQKAESTLRRLLQLHPRHAVALNNLSWLLATCEDPKRRKPTEAVELARKAVELTAEEGTAWNTLGVAHYRAGNWKAAIESLEKSRQLSQGGDSFDFFFLAMAHWQLGQMEEAHQWYQRAVEWVEKNSAAHAQNPQWTEELRRFRAETKELLKAKE
jgi:tetratricopeptide (TPR) repeat protein